MAEPERKKARIENKKNEKEKEDAGIFKLFLEDDECFNLLKYWIEELTREKGNAIAALQIKFCNAAIDDYAFSFSNAICLTDINTETLFSFTSIFLHGLKMLKAYIDDKTVPREKHMKIVLSKLLRFILDKNSKEHLKRLNTDKEIKETDMAVRLSQHFFSKLTTSPAYTLDKCCHNKRSFDTCCCGCNEVFKGEFGDTSIGNPKCWHGHLDMLVSSCDIFVKVGTEDEEPRTPGERSSGQEDIQKTEVISQILAQTIVFSYLQKKRHPEYDHFLIPSIGVSKREIIFHFFDSQNDVLLKSPAFQLFSDGELSMRAVLSTWFVINYKYLCSGITSDIKKAPRANFKDHISRHTEWYEDELLLGNVSGQPLTKYYEPLNYRSKFVFPQLTTEETDNEEEKDPETK